MYISISQNFPLDCFLSLTYSSLFLFHLLFSLSFSESVSMVDILSLSLTFERHKYLQAIGNDSFFFFLFFFFLLTLKKHSELKSPSNLCPTRISLFLSLSLSSPKRGTRVRKYVAKRERKEEKEKKQEREGERERRERATQKVDGK